MKRNQLLSISLALSSMTACGQVGSQVTIDGVIFPMTGTAGAGCKFDPTQTMFLSDITYDTAAMQDLTLFLKVTNSIPAQTVMFGGSMGADNFVAPNAVTPLRMDVRWECDSEGFAQNLGPMYLPQYSTTQPFCINNVSKDFVGFDVILASGAPIKAGSSGSVQVQPIPVQLGAAFGDVFHLADLAQRCCDAAGSCKDTDLMMHANDPACQELQNVFNTVAGNNQLSAQHQVDVDKFAPFAIFDWAGPNPSSKHGAYAMRLHGVLEGVFGDGNTISSTEWQDLIHLCANCVMLTPMNPESCLDIY
jgi:hypothetical protein